jgi:hypothetical protein
MIRAHGMTSGLIEISTRLRPRRQNATMIGHCAPALVSAANVTALEDRAAIPPRTISAP